MKMQIIKREDLFELIRQISSKGARAISVDIVSEKKLLVKDRITKLPHAYGKTVLKHSNYNCFLNFDYEISVNRAMVKQGKGDEDAFEAKDNWFFHDEICSSVIHSKSDPSKCYVQLKYQKTLEKSKYYLESGDEVNKEEIENLLPLASENKSQNLENPVITMTVSFSSIRAIRAEGAKFIIADQQKVEKIGGIKIMKVIEMEQI